MYFVIWNGRVECGVVQYGMCYNDTTPWFATAHHHILHNTATDFHVAPHHSSIIPHLIAQHSTSLHVTQYRPRFATSHHHIWHIMWCNGIRCDVSCDMEWCMKWSVEWDVTHYTTCFATSHHCILHITAAHLYGTATLPVESYAICGGARWCSGMWCNEQHARCGVSCAFVIQNGSCGMWCGSRCGLMWNGMRDVYNVTAPHTLPHCTTA